MYHILACCLAVLLTVAAVVWAQGSPSPTGVTAGGPASAPSSTSASSPSTQRAALPPNAKVVYDVEYARVGDKSLQMDIYTPADVKGTLPAVMYIHGGGWRRGDKRQSTPLPLIRYGYVIATINHRTSTEAIFPAQIEDCKAALRSCANAAKYHIDADHIGVWGDSSGGHLAALVGASGGVAELEGTVGNHLDQSSKVQAVCDYYGPIDFIAIMDQKSDIKRGGPDAPESALLGGPTLEHKDLAVKASPLTYITKDCPPFLIVYGEKDARVPVDQHQALQAALKAVGVEANIKMIPGAGHGFDAKQNMVAIPDVAAFFDKHLKKTAASGPSK